MRLFLSPVASRRRRQVAFAAAVVLPITVEPAFAIAQSGEIIVLRQVDARNAITPGTGAPLTVKTAPDNAFFNVMGTNLRLLSDADAALVAGGKPGASGLDETMRMGLDSVFGTQRQTYAANSEHSSGGGGTISNSIGLGMGALQNALGSLRASVPRGQ
jgi:hypothetical protein